MNETHPLPFYADDVNPSEDHINAIKNTQEILFTLGSGSTDKHRKNTGQNYGTNIPTRSFENAAQFRYLEIKSNAYYHSVQNLLSSRLSY
jgi:hypothetical protein